jgi:hypothetical protein
MGKFYHPAAVAREQIVELQTRPEYRYEFQLDLPTRAQLLATSITDADLASSTSDKGRYAEGLLMRLQNLEVLRKPFVIDCIEALTTHRVQYDARRLRQEFSNTGITNAELDRLAASLQHVRQDSRTLRDIVARIHSTTTEAAAAVHILVTTGLAVRGFQGRCPICSMVSFFELRDVGAAVVCPGCASTAEISSDPVRGESELYYRLSSLVDRASDNGVVIHLLLAAALRRRDPRVQMTLGVNLFKSGTQKEFDCIALLGPDIWVGEAKTTAARFTDSQIVDDIDWAARVRASHYVMVCLQPIPQQARLKASDAAARVGIRPWILEGLAGEMVPIG